MNKKKNNLYITGALLLCAGMALLVISIPLRFYGKGSPILILLAMASILASIIVNIVYTKQNNKKNILKSKIK